MRIPQPQRKRKDSLFGKGEIMKYSYLLDEDDNTNKLKLSIFGNNDGEPSRKFTHGFGK